MAYILSRDRPEFRTPEDFSRPWRQYREHLESIRERVPESAFEFATRPCHDYEDHRCLHDSWVESLTIREPSSGDRHEVRSLEIEVRLLGAYHDGYLTLKYRDVQSYSLDTPLESQSPGSDEGHGDWLYDEVTFSKGTFVLHEVEFRRGSRWLIECADIECTCEPISNPGTPT